MDRPLRWMSNATAVLVVGYIVSLISTFYIASQAGALVGGLYLFGNGIYKTGFFLFMLLILWLGKSGLRLSAKTQPVDTRMRSTKRYILLLCILGAIALSPEIKIARSIIVEYVTIKRQPAIFERIVTGTKLENHVWNSDSDRMVLNQDIDRFGHPRELVIPGKVEQYEILKGNPASSYKNPILIKDKRSERIVVASGMSVILFSPIAFPSQGTFVMDADAFLRTGTVVGTSTYGPPTATKKEVPQKPSEMRVVVNPETLATTSTMRIFSGTATGLQKFETSIYTNNGSDAGEKVWGGGTERIIVNDGHWFFRVLEPLPKGLYSLIVFNPTCSFYDDACKALVFERFEVK